MKKLLFVLLVLAVSISLFAEDNQLDLHLIGLSMPTVITATTEVNSDIFRVPQLCKAETLYITNTQSVATNATDYLAIKLMRNNLEVARFTSTATAMVAYTAVAMPWTSSTHTFAAGDILQAQMTKGGGGKSVTETLLSIGYYNGN